MSSSPVEIHLGPTSFRASNSERNKAWPWPNFSSERTEGEAAKLKKVDSASQFVGKAELTWLSLDHTSERGPARMFIGIFGLFLVF